MVEVLTLDIAQRVANSQAGLSSKISRIDDIERSGGFQ